MKSKTAKREFNQENSKSPLLAGSSADGRPNKEEERKNKDLVERERKKMQDEEEVKRKKEVK